MSGRVNNEQVQQDSGCAGNTFCSDQAQPRLSAGQQDSKEAKGGETCGTMPLRFCFIMLLMTSGLVIICSCADFCSDFWLKNPVSCVASARLPWQGDSAKRSATYTWEAAPHNALLTPRVSRMLCKALQTLQDALPLTHAK